MNRSHLRRALGLSGLLALLTSVSPAMAAFPVDRPTVVVTQSGGMTPQTQAVLLQVADLTSAEITFVHTGSMRMMSVFREGRPLQIPPAGFGYPMAIEAVEYGLAGLPGSIREAFAADRIVMSERSAALRGARAGDIVTLEGWHGGAVAYRIGAIVPDADVNWYEIVISSRQAATLGMHRPSSARIWNADLASLATFLNYMLPRQGIAVSFPGQVRHNPNPVLPTVVVKEVLGEFSYRPAAGRAVDLDPNWLAENIVTVEIPELGRFRCHRLVVPFLRSAIGQIRDEDLASVISYRDFQAAGGCFNARLMAGGENGYILSRHAWGGAVDINPSSNPFGQPPTLDPRVGEILRQWGFAWGATWTVPDGMHFEWTHYPDDEVTPTCSDSWILASSDGFEVYDRSGGCGSE